MTARLPSETIEALKRAIDAGLRPLRATPPVPYSTWAAEHFDLDEESSHQRGLFVPWPFQIGWMDAFSNDDIEEVNVEKAKRVGYTKTIVGFAEYNASHRRRKLAIWQPTDDDRDSFVKSEITPSFDICRALDPVRRLGRDDDTIKFKRFRGSVQHYLGAKAARSFRRITIAVGILDEVDAMDQIVEKTIDPVTGAKGRLEGAPFPKLILGTTPRHKLTSHVRRRVEAADAVMEYRITCPHCEADHPLMWGGSDVPHGFKWQPGEPGTVRHHCPHCHNLITQADYLAIWQDGRWTSRCGTYLYDHTAKVWTDQHGQPRTPPRHVAFVNAWTAYSPQRTWADIVREFLEARKAQKLGDSGPMQGFKNETLADVWEEEYDHTDATVLRDRSQRDTDIPLQLVPDGACKILMGIDTQQDRWEAVAWAIGEGEEMWPIDYRVIYGNPAQQEEWFEKLNPVIEATYRHINGKQMQIDAVGIDTGGTNWTHQAYNYCRAMTARRVFATKGDQALGAPIKMKPSWIDVNAHGKILKRGVRLWRICVDTAKDLLHGRLDQVKKAGPGHIHLNRHLPPEWFDQLTAEHRIRVRLAHGWADRWVCPSGRRNEVLDCTVIVLFLIHAMGYNATPPSTWQRWRDELAPDLFSAPPITVGELAQQAFVPPQAPPEPPPPPKPAIAQRTPPKPPPRASGIAHNDWSSRL